MRARRDIIDLILAGSLLVAALATAAPARAQNEPVIVVPGRPGVPVMMYGVDVSGAVIEGEFGLNQPGQVAPTVIMPFWPQDIFALPGPYYPSTGHRPRVGRLEVIPPAHRRLPPEAEPYYRTWSIEPAPESVTDPVPYDPPPVMLAPRFARRHSHNAPAVPLPPARPQTP
jgi:hypothetical protein